MVRLTEKQIGELAQEVLLAISSQVGASQAMRLLPTVVAAMAKASEAEAENSETGSGGCQGHCGHCSGSCHSSAERHEEVGSASGKRELTAPSHCGIHRSGALCKCSATNVCLKSNGDCQCRSREKSGQAAHGQSLREKLCAVGRQLSALGMVAGASGNISVRDTDNTFLISPSGVHKGDLRPETLIRVNLAGQVVEGSSKPSTETSIHLKAYQCRPDVNAVLHAHPPFATSFAAARTTLDLTVLAEAWITMGPKIPLVTFAVPSTPEVGEGLEPWIRDHQAFLLANHGAMTVGKDLLQATQRMETLEFLAKVIINARILGGEHPLGQAERQRVAAVHKLSYT